VSNQVSNIARAQTHTYIYTQQPSMHQFTMYYGRFIIVNYVSEHQFSHVVKGIPYYAYYTCQLGFYVIWNWQI